MNSKFFIALFLIGFSLQLNVLFSQEAHFDVDLAWGETIDEKDTEMKFFVGKSDISGNSFVLYKRKNEYSLVRLNSDLSRVGKGEFHP